MTPSNFRSGVIREDSSMGYEPWFTTEIYGSKPEKTVFHEYPQETCCSFLQTSLHISGNLRGSLLEHAIYESCTPLTPLPSLTRVNRFWFPRLVKWGPFPYPLFYLPIKFYILQRGMQWKQVAVICMVLFAMLLYNTTPIHRTPIPLHSPVMN